MKKEVMGLIVKREDGSEIVNYDDDSFPSYIYEIIDDDACMLHRDFADSTEDAISVPLLSLVHRGRDDGPLLLV